jgi:YidC/Oxa1 family membrane protein insertase
MLLLWLYEVFKNYGVAVIFFTIIVKVILLPFQMKSKRGQMQMQRIQPRVKELEKKHGANKQAYTAAVQALYKEEGVSMTGGCLWQLIPFPIMLALYQVIRYPLTIMMGVSETLIQEGGAIFNKLSEFIASGTYVPKLGPLYSQIDQAQFIGKHIGDFADIPGLHAVSFNFLGLDLGIQPTWKFLWSSKDFIATMDITWAAGFFLFLIPIISAAVTLAQTLISQKMNPPADLSQNQMAGTMKGMTYIMPIMIAVFGFGMPAAVSVYWIVSGLIGLIQDIILTKRYTKKLDAEDAVRNKARAERDAQLERKRLETERLKALDSTAKNPNTSKEKRKIEEKRERELRRAEWERKNGIAPEPEENPAREGQRKFARGRAYDPTRYPDTPEPEFDDEDEDAEDTADGADGFDVDNELDEMFGGGENDENDE